MPTIAKVRRDFQNALGGARALFAFCLSPRGLHSEAGVEAAFLQMYKAWEGLLEEAFIAYMCQRLSFDGAYVASHVRAASDDIARGVLYQNRPFVEWSDPDVVRDRAKCYFHGGSRIEAAFGPALGPLREMTKLRNAIAHASPLARRRFYELVQQVFGGAPVIARPAEFLIQNDPQNPTTTLFDRYATVLEVTATKITG